MKIEPGVLVRYDCEYRAGFCIFTQLQWLFCKYLENNAWQKMNVEIVLKKFNVAKLFCQNTYIHQKFGL